MSIYLTFIAGAGVTFTRKHQCVCKFSVGSNLIFCIVHRHVGDTRTVKATFRTSEIRRAVRAAPVEKSFSSLILLRSTHSSLGISLQIF